MKMFGNRYGNVCTACECYLIAHLKMVTMFLLHVFYDNYNKNRARRKRLFHIAIRKQNIKSSTNLIIK